MSIIDKKEVDKQLALFKEGEAIAIQQKLMGYPRTLKDIADTISFEVLWGVSCEQVINVIKVYQGFLDNGGQIDFTKE